MRFKGYNLQPIIPKGYNRQANEYQLFMCRVVGVVPFFTTLQSSTRLICMHVILHIPMFLYNNFYLIRGTTPTTFDSK